MPLAGQLALARSASGLGQDDVANALGVSRAMVSYWESGKRRPNDRQLAALSRLLRTSMAVLLGHEEREPEPDLAAMLLRVNDGHAVPDEAVPGVREFIAFLNSYAQLAEAAKFQIRGLSQSPFVTSTDYQSADDARRKAEEVRSLLRVGLGPIGDVDTVCEQLGITVYRASLGQDLTKTPSGAFFNHQHGVGYSILVNLDMTPGRRRFTVAHEIAHALFHSDSPFVVSTALKPPRERFADMFAGEFLMPTEGMRRFVEDLGLGPRLSSPSEVIHLQRYFGVSYATALLRCYKAKFVTHPQYDEFSRVHPLALARALGYQVSDEEVRPSPDRWRIERFPLRFRRLLRMTVQREIISASSAANLTGLTVDEIEELAAVRHPLGTDDLSPTDDTERNEYAASGVV